MKLQSSFFFFFFILFISLQVADSVPVGNSTTQTLDETFFTCDDTKQQLDIPGGEYDAVFVEVSAHPDLETLFCSSDSTTKLSLSSGDSLDVNRCPDQLIPQWMIYDNQGIRVTIEHRDQQCETKGVFSLNVTYQYWRCWDAVEPTTANYPLHMEQLCGLARLSGAELVKETDLCNGFRWQPIIANNLPSFIASGMETLVTVESSVTPLDTEHLLPDLCPEGQFILALHYSYDLCASSRRFSISSSSSLDRRLAVFGCLNATRKIDPREWEGNTRFENYLKDNKDTSPAEALFQFYNVSLSVRFGIFSRKSQRQDEDKMLPLQIRQNELGITVRLLPDAILSFSTWIYRILLQVPPGKQVEARWKPLPGVDYSFIFAQTTLGGETDTFGYAIWKVFGDYSSGYAVSFHTEMVIFVSMRRLVSWKDVQSREGRSDITVITFNVLPMQNMCDEQSIERNVTISRLVLDNSETFWVTKNTPRYQDTLTCHLAFRTQTDDSVFLSRVWLTSEDECLTSNLFVIVGSRYVSMCRKLDFEQSTAFLFVATKMSSYIAYNYAVINSLAISVVAYSTSTQVSVGDRDVPGVTGQLITTCPLASNSSQAQSPCTMQLQQEQVAYEGWFYCDYLSSKLLYADQFPRGHCLLSLGHLDNDSWHSAILPSFFDVEKRKALNVLNSTTGTMFALMPRPLIETPEEFSHLVSHTVLIRELKPLGNNSYLEIALEVAPSGRPRTIPLLSINDSHVDLLFLAHNHSLDAVRLRTIGFWFRVFAPADMLPCLIVKYTTKNYFSNDSSSNTICPAGFTRVADDCFRVAVLSASQNRSWDAALESCQKSNSSLLTTADRNELDRALWLTKPVFEKMVSGTHLFVHLGLRRVNKSLEWVDPSIPVTIAEWFHPTHYGGNEMPVLPNVFNLSPNTSQPTTGTGDCVAMIPHRPSGPANWVMVPCSQEPANTNVAILEMCLIRTKHSLATLTPWSTLYCPAGWIRMKSKCLKLISRSDMTMDTANATCRAVDGVVSHFSVAVHNTLFRVLLQHPHHGSKWMNNTQLTPFRLLSDVTRELVPASNVTASGVVCEHEDSYNVVDLQHGFEKACSDDSVIGFYRWCDGVSDCPRGEDEVACDSGGDRPKHPDTSNWNTIAGSQAWSEADREAFTGWIQLHPHPEESSSGDTDSAGCNKEAVACLGGGNESCIPQTHVCVFGVQGCPDFSHLSSCEQFECPRMFKCPSSYCISLNRVCDGRNDCPHGDDELGCDGICAGMYRCGRRCIPMTAVCDGVIQCEDGDDELYCPRPDAGYCPVDCRCHDTAISCDRLTDTLHVPAITEVVDLSGAISGSFVFLDLTATKRLLSLNASNCSMSTIPPRRFAALSSLRSLDVSYNRIRSLQIECFEGLSSLDVISLKGNPIAKIVPFALSPLSHVSSLDLSGMSIAAIQGHTFAGMSNLSDLYLQNNVIASLEKMAFFGTPALRAVYLGGNPIASLDADIFDSHAQLSLLISDRKELCCATAVRGTCFPVMSVTGFCERVIPFMGMRIVVYLGTAVCLGGNFGLLMWLLVKRRTSPLSLHLSVFLLNEVLVGVHLLCVLVGESSYPVPFFPNMREWPRSVHCNVCGILATLALLGSSGSLVHMAVAYLFQRRLLLMSGAVVLLQLSVLPPYFLFDATFYGRLSSCVAGLFFAGEGWWLSLLWTVIITVAPLSVVVITVRRWRKEYDMYKGFPLRQIDKREDQLAILRMHAMLAWTALMNVGLGAVWLSEALGLTGTESDGLIWSSLVAVPLRSVLILGFYCVSIAVSHRVMEA